MAFTFDDNVRDFSGNDIISLETEALSDSILQICMIVADRQTKNPMTCPIGNVNSIT